MDAQDCKILDTELVEVTCEYEAECGVAGSMEMLAPWGEEGGRTVAVECFSVHLIF